jgi:hypothetical protein
MDGDLEGEGETINLILGGQEPDDADEANTETAAQ